MNTEIAIMPPIDFTRKNCVVRTEVDQYRLPVLMWYVHLLADPRRPTGTAEMNSNETPIIRRKFVN